MVRRVGWIGGSVSGTFGVHKCLNPADRGMRQSLIPAENVFLGGS